MMKWAHNLQHLSAYKRCDAHLTTQTTHGAVVTLLGVLLGVTLTIHELSWFLTGGGVAKTTVDLARRHDLAIHMDISFPAIPCAGLSVDVMDASGSTGNDVSRGKDLQIHKIRLDDHGRKLGGREGEYHTPLSQKLVQDKQGTVMQIDLGAAMTQMGDMESEIKGHEGCRVMGDIVVRRVAGKLHFAVHQQSFVDVLPQMLTGHVLPHLTNMSHVINKVAFGPEFPGQANPLDGFRRITAPGDTLKAYKYFLKIVPTEYLSRMGFRLETNQYSVNEFAMTVAGTGPGHSSQAAPGSNVTGAIVVEPFIDFSYDLSPIMMTVAQSPADLLHFLVRLCAVVGGVLSVTRMADKAVHALLVAAGYVQRPPSIKARHSTGSMAGGYGSLRSSLAGGLDNGSLPGSGRSSYAGGGGAYSAGGAPGSPHAGRGSAYSSNGGLLPDGSAHYRAGTTGGGAAANGAGAPLVASHPLSHMTSNASSYLVGMGSYGGALAGMGSAGGAGGGYGSIGGAALGSPSPVKASGGGAGLGGSLGGAGFGPAAGGPLYKGGSLGGVGSPAGSTGGALSGSVGGAAPGGQPGSGLSSASASGTYRPYSGAGASGSPAGLSAGGSGSFGGALVGSGDGARSSGAGSSGGGSLLGRSTGGGLPAAAPGSRAGSSAGGAPAGSAGGHALGGFNSAPLAGLGGGSSGGAMGMAGLGASRLSTASGPGSRPASGPGNGQQLPGARAPVVGPPPGSPLKQQ